jgi:hypothetical protein
MSNWLHHAHRCTYTCTYTIATSHTHTRAFLIRCPGDGGPSRLNPGAAPRARPQEAADGDPRASCGQAGQKAVPCRQGACLGMLENVVFARNGWVSRVLDSPIRSTARERVLERSLLHFVLKARTGSPPDSTVTCATRPHDGRVQCATVPHPNRGRLRS